MLSVQLGVTKTSCVKFKDTVAPLTVPTPVATGVSPHASKRSRFRTPPDWEISTICGSTCGGTREPQVLEETVVEARHTPSTLAFPSGGGVVPPGPWPGATRPTPPKLVPDSSLSSAWGHPSERMVRARRGKAAPESPYLMVRH